MGLVHNALPLSFPCLLVSSLPFLELFPQRCVLPLQLQHHVGVVGQLAALLLIQGDVAAHDVCPQVDTAPVNGGVVELCLYHFNLCFIWRGCLSGVLYLIVSIIIFK